MAGQDWDVDVPIDHSKVSARPSQTRDLKLATKTIIQKEHAALGASNSGGQHLKGAARVYMSGSLPTLMPDGVTSLGTDASTGTNNGRVAIVTGGGVSTGLTNTMRVYVATSAGVSTGFQGVRAAYAGTAVRVSLDNDAFIKALKAGEPSTSIDMIKVNSTGVLEIASAHAAVLMTSAAPTVDGHVANMKYVDDSIATADYAAKEIDTEYEVTAKFEFVRAYAEVNLPASGTDWTLILYGKASGGSYVIIDKAYASTTHGDDPLADWTYSVNGLIPNGWTWKVEDVGFSGTDIKSCAIGQ